MSFWLRLRIPYPVITLRFSGGTRFMTRIAVFDSRNCGFFFRVTACSIDWHELSTASKACSRNRFFVFMNGLQHRLLALHGFDEFRAQ